MITLDDAKKAISKLLKATNITEVYYIDDIFQDDKEIDEHFEEFLAAIEECLSEGHTEDIPKKIIYAGIDNLEDEVRRWWTEMTLDQKKQMLKRYISGYEENRQPTVSIQAVMDERCICCSPSVWDKEYKTNVKAKISAGQSILLLFDYALSKERTGLQYAEEALALDTDCAYCGIISNQFRIDNEFQQRDDYKKQNPKHYIYPLSKERLTIDTEDYSAFISGLKNILWVKHIELIKEHTNAILQKAFNETINRYLDIQPPTYKQIIVDSSYTEGCQEIDTILRLFQIILDKKIKESITEDTLSLINKNSDLILDIQAQSDVNCEYPEVNDQAISFIKDERFLDGSIINSIYAPIQNGDIFKINKTLYILLCQPCNISIRSEGKRGNNDYDTGFLVKLDLTKNIGVSKKHTFYSVWSKIENELQNKGVRPEILQSQKKELAKLLELENASNIPLTFKIGNPGKLYTVRLKDFHTFSLSLLDSVSFNKDGKAIINSVTTGRPIWLHRNLYERQKQIIDQMKDWRQFKHNLNELCYDCQWLFDIKAISSKLFNGIKYEYSENDQIILPIQRIGHYRRPYSDDLLTQFSHYISRAGFPHPFVKM
jgi:hypothetical protein